MIDRKKTQVIGGVDLKETVVCWPYKCLISGDDRYNQKGKAGSWQCNKISRKKWGLKVQIKDLE